MRDIDVRRLVDDAESKRADVSVQVTEAPSPDRSPGSGRRLAHSRSNSDVTPGSVSVSSPAPRALPVRKPHPRSHSLGARPGQKRIARRTSPVEKSSIEHLSVDFPHIEISTLSSILAEREKTPSPFSTPRKIRSERGSPEIAVMSVVENNFPVLLEVSTVLTAKSGSQLIYIPSDPWTKMTNDDCKPMGKFAHTNHLSLDYASTENGPWVLHDAFKGSYQNQRRSYRKSNSLSKQRSGYDGKHHEALDNSFLPKITKSVTKYNRCSPSCELCGSIDLCKCKNATENSIVSPKLIPPEVVLSCPKSPSNPRSDRSYDCPTRSPIFPRNEKKLSSSNLIKVFQNMDMLYSSDESDSQCICNKSIVSSRPSPRKSPSESAHNEISHDTPKNEIEVASTNNLNHCHSNDDVADPAKAKQKKVNHVEGGICAVEPALPQDPLLETTC